MKRITCILLMAFLLVGCRAAIPTSTLAPHPTQSSTPTPRHNETAPPTQTALTAMGARQYTITDGENLFGIAKKFGLKPETVLWANPSTLQDNPNHIKPGIILRIPAVDGLYYHWQAGDTIETVASRYGVDANAILDWPENAALIGAIDQPTIQPGGLLFIPGGKMPLQ